MKKMFNFINKTEDVPSKRRLWACVQNLIYYQINYNISKNILLNIFIGLITLNIIYPKHINADNLILNNINQKNKNIILILNNKNFILNHFNSTPIINKDINTNIELVDFNKVKLNLAKNTNEKNYKKINLWITAYSSSPDETDDDPFITASGSFTRDGIAATNILPFGTKIQIPSLFGNKIFTIEDKMHKRKTNFIDIWMDSKEKALQFGIHYAEIIILEKEAEFAKN